MNATMNSCPAGDGFARVSFSVKAASEKREREIMQSMGAADADGEVELLANGDLGHEPAAALDPEMYCAAAWESAA